MTRRTARRWCLVLAAVALWGWGLVALVATGAAPLSGVIATVLSAVAATWWCGFFANVWADAPPERRIVPLAPVERARQAEYDG